MASFTTEEEFKESYETLFKTFASGRTKSLAWRKWQLKQLWWLLDDNEEKIVEALFSDLHRHPFETFAMEMRGMKGDVIENLENVETWAQGDRPEAGFFMGTLGKARLRKEPLGVALIMGAWNFPMLLTVSPMIAAIAAGNCILIKPSELAPSTQALLIELIPKYLDSSAIRVVTGGPQETTMMLEHKFNHIFYTGSTTVGRLVARAASKHLTPTVLELGGQAPAIVCKSANIDVTAKRIAYAKLLNLGQICLNVNHVFVDPEIEDKLIERLIHWNDVFLNNSPDDFSRIINERNFDRITSLLKRSSGEVVYGGNSDRGQKFIKPTIVKNLSMSDSLLSEELFGPIAPIITADVESAISTINSMPHPLGLYIFSQDQSEIDRIINSTTSGGVTVNDVMVHAGVPNAPFGGVGDSGYGSYHGKFGFDAFSHTRTIVAPPTWMDSLMSFRYAPYDIKNRKYFDIENKLGFKKGETMEDQSVGPRVSVTKVAARALFVITGLALLDSASGGRFLFVHTMKDVAHKLRWS